MERQGPRAEAVEGGIEEPAEAAGMEAGRAVVRGRDRRHGQRRRAGGSAAPLALQLCASWPRATGEGGDGVVNARLDARQRLAGSPALLAQNGLVACVSYAPVGRGGAAHARGN